jgi:hypothetical protein
MTALHPPHRWPCGRLKKHKPHKLKKSIVQALAEIEREKRLLETQTVRDQPHRRGDDSVLPESALGSFVSAHDLGMDTYTACMAYYRSWHALCSIKGIPTAVRLDESDNTGEEFTDKQIKELVDRVKFCEFELKRAGEPAFWSAKDLICSDIPVPEKRVLPVKRVLISLTGMLGYVPRERASIRSTLQEERKEARRQALVDKESGAA